jgi:Integrase core domain
MDFKDVSSVSPEQSPQSKRQHVIEVCNFVDAGTSIALFAQAREDFHEQTAMEAVIIFLQTYGRPRQITFDRDPRWVGGNAGRDFPSPLRRLLLCLEIEPNICPPHRPDKNAYVERYHRTYGQECLQRHQKASLQEVREVTDTFLQHYNYERPHQGRACGNVPPRVAFPRRPSLPALPEWVDPDRWLTILNHQAYLRRVGRDGCESARSGNLLYRSANGGMSGPLAGGCQRCAVCRLACGRGASRSCRSRGLGVTMTESHTRCASRGQ